MFRDGLLTDDQADIVLRIPEAGVRLMSPTEVAEMLNVSEATLRRWAAEGEGPPFYSWAKEPFYLRSEVSQWLVDGFS